MRGVIRLNTASDSPVSVLDGSPTAPFLFVCEHASAHIPDRYGGLGLDDGTRRSHVAWDPGAETVTRALARAFDAPAVLGRVSRLVYDCNRPPESPGAMPPRSEIFDIPGNAGLSEAEKAERIDTIYRPFEAALAGAIDARRSAPALVTIHSFTPVYFGQRRDVELGILHDEDARFADAVLAVAARHTTLDVRRNEPYGPADGVTHTLRRHGLSRNLLNVMIEVRNDLLASESECAAIAAMLAGLLRDALATLSPSTPAQGATA